MSECCQCSDMLKQMQLGDESEHNIEINLKEAESIRNLSKKWNRKLILAAVKGILSTLIIICLILLIIYCFVGIKLH